MKVLLAVTLTMLIGNSAFAACSPTTPNECTDKASCEGLSDNSKKFTFVPNGSAKCISSDGPVATNCTENKDGGRGGKEAAAGGQPAASGSSTAAPK